MRVLVVEDARRLADGIAEGLRDEGMAVDLCYDGSDALSRSPSTATTWLSSTAISRASTAMRMASRHAAPR